MNKTENLKLNVWEKTDPIHAKDFNDNFQTLDSAVQVCSKIAYGSYVGTGYNGENHPNRLDFADTLGTAPKIVFVISDTGAYQLSMLHGMTQQNHLGVSAMWTIPATSDGQTPALNGTTRGRPIAR